MDKKDKAEAPRRVPLRSRTPLRTNPSTVGFSSTDTAAGQTSKTMSDGKGGSLKVSQIMAAGGVTATPHTTGTLPKIGVDKDGNIIKPPTVDKSTEDLTLPMTPPGGTQTSTEKTTGISTEATPTTSPSAHAHGGDDKKTGGKVVDVDEQVTKQRSFRHPVYNGWAPDLHAMWSMLLIPFLCGALISSFRWGHLLLFLVWVSGYFSMFSLDVWLRSGRKERYWYPLRTYAIITSALCIILLIVMPSLLEWSILFLVLTAIGLKDPALHQRRTLLTRTATAFTASMMLVISYDVGTNFTRTPQFVPWLQHSVTQTTPVTTWVPYSVVVNDYTWAFVMAMSFFAYFFSNMLFVGSMIRRSYERRRKMFIASVLTHLFFVIVVWIGAAFRIVPIGHAVAWLIPLFRAIALPLLRRRINRVALLRKAWQKTRDDSSDEPWDATEGKLELRSSDILFDDTPSTRSLTKLLVFAEIALTIFMAVTLFI